MDAIQPWLPDWRCAWCWVRLQGWIEPILSDYYCQWINGELICGNPPFGGPGINFGGGKDSDVVKASKCEIACNGGKGYYACNEFCEGDPTCRSQCMSNSQTKKKACSEACD